MSDAPTRYTSSVYNLATVILLVCAEVTEVCEVLLHTCAKGREAEACSARASKEFAGTTTAAAACNHRAAQAGSASKTMEFANVPSYFQA